MNTSLITKVAIATSAVALSALGAIPATAQTTVPRQTADLAVLKRVDGTAPSGTSFILHITCEQGNLERAGALPTRQAQVVVVDQDITFGAEGGTEHFTFDEEAECVVTETDDGGADSSSGPVTIDITDPADFVAEIINTFDPLPTTTAPAAEAAAVEATPAFTG